jgi:hypothetical protein
MNNDHIPVVYTYHINLTTPPKYATSRSTPTPQAQIASHNQPIELITDTSELSHHRQLVSHAHGLQTRHGRSYERVLTVARGYVVESSFHHSVAIICAL